MVDLSHYAEETVADTDTELPPEEIAVRQQAIVEKLKTELEIATSRRDAAVLKAYAQGVRVYSGYRFSEVKPTDVLSETKLTKMYPEIADGYSLWYLNSREVKLTKTELKKYLKQTACKNPDKVIEDVIMETFDAPTYRLIRDKGAEE